MGNVGSGNHTDAPEVRWSKTVRLFTCAEYAPEVLAVLVKDKCFSSLLCAEHDCRIDACINDCSRHKAGALYHLHLPLCLSA